MFKFNISVMTLLLAVSFNGAKANENPNDFDFICKKIMQSDANFSEKDYAFYFDKSFIEKIPYSKFQDIFSEIKDNVGSCLHSSVESRSTSEQFILNIQTNLKFEVSFSLRKGAVSNQITYFQLLNINNPAVSIHSWEDVGHALQSLDPNGKLAATLKTSDHKIQLQFSNEQLFAIGSTFKLYILGALQSAIAAQKHSWTETLSISEKLKSLPSGKMQDLPSGTTLSLEEFASNMISISDNTAADHLLDFLGRDFVQSLMPMMGNQHSELNDPFLSTLEMFKLKWAVDPILTEKYLSSDKKTKIKILADLSEVDRNLVGSNGVAFDLPTLISKLEWFGTTDDTCNAILWIGNQESPNLRKILSKYVPLLQNVGTESSHWAFAGYKGGSEPGVLNMSFLLETKSGQRACLSMSWNNEKTPLSNFVFSDVVNKTLKFAESIL